MLNFGGSSYQANAPLLIDTDAINWRAAEISGPLPSNLPAGNNVPQHAVQRMRAAIAGSRYTRPVERALVPAVTASVAAAILFLWFGEPISSNSRIQQLAIPALAAGSIGAIAGMLGRRGWGTLGAVTASLLIALQPTILHSVLAAPERLILTAMALLLGLMLDRAEAVGDPRSLMAIGLTIAVGAATSPFMFLVIISALIILPIAWREMTGGSSACALFIAALFPTLILLGVALSSSPLSLSGMLELPGRMASAAVAVTAEEDPTAWLGRHGGSFIAPISELIISAAILAPAFGLVVLRLSTSAVERRRPATALFALLGGPFAGASASLLFMSGALWNAVAVTVALIAAWTVTTHLRRSERWIWLVAMTTGVAAAWLGPWLWSEPVQATWRSMLVG